MTTTTVVRTGLWFGEGPRWHDGRLWYSDFYDRSVHAMADDGSDERVLGIDDQPSGLGWLPGGDLLVVSMTARRLLRRDPEGNVSVHADLSANEPVLNNDMVVDRAGRAYVGGFGFDLERFLEPADGQARGKPVPTVLSLVGADGTVSVAADDLHFPNGTVITPDGRTLVVAETFGQRLTAFDVAADGTLSGRRVWADVGGIAPDGICLDSEGAIWVADALSSSCVRILEGGEVSRTLSFSQSCFACALGGDDGRTLYAMTAPSSSRRVASAAPAGRIEAARVEVSAADSP